MVTDRRFCRFSKQAETMSFGMPDIPDGGLCLSAFLVIADVQNPNSVLMGHLNPEASWDRIGALDRSRVDAHSKRWMLPSSHLIVYESPQEAAKRIPREQLEMRDDLPLVGPQVVSETYTPKRFRNLHQHWDIEFIFKGKLLKHQIPKPHAWSQLDFVDLSSIDRSDIARSHEDILETSGMTLKPPAMT